MENNPQAGSSIGLSQGCNAHTGNNLGQAQGNANSLSQGCNAHTGNNLGQAQGNANVSAEVTNGPPQGNTDQHQQDPQGNSTPPQPSYSDEDIASGKALFNQYVSALNRPNLNYDDFPIGIHNVFRRINPDFEGAFVTSSDIQTIKCSHLYKLFGDTDVGLQCLCHFTCFQEWLAEPENEHLVNKIRGQKHTVGAWMFDFKFRGHPQKGLQALAGDLVEYTLRNVGQPIHYAPAPEFTAAESLNLPASNEAPPAATGESERPRNPPAPSNGVSVPPGPSNNQPPQPPPQPLPTRLDNTPLPSHLAVSNPANSNVINRSQCPLCAKQARGSLKFCRGDPPCGRCENLGLTAKQCATSDVAAKKKTTMVWRAKWVPKSAAGMKKFGGGDGKGNSGASGIGGSTFKSK